MSKDKSTEILKKHFKALYGYAGKEWTLEDDKNIEQLVDALEGMIEEKTNELIDTGK